MDRQVTAALMDLGKLSAPVKKELLNSLTHFKNLLWSAPLRNTQARNRCLCFCIALVALALLLKKSGSLIASLTGAIVPH